MIITTEEGSFYCDDEYRAVLVREGLISQDSIKDNNGGVTCK